MATSDGEIERTGLKLKSNGKFDKFTHNDCPDILIMYFVFSSPALLW